MRLGVVAGIHEDVTRRQQALDVLSEAGWEAIACLGDIVGYSVPYYGFLKYRDAHHTVQLVKRHCQYVVVGNHDLYAVRKLSTQQQVFAYPANWYALDWVTRRELARDQVWLLYANRKTRNRIRGLPFVSRSIDVDSRSLGGQWHVCQWGVST